MVDDRRTSKRKSRPIASSDDCCKSFQGIGHRLLESILPPLSRSSSSSSRPISAPEDHCHQPSKATGPSKKKMKRKDVLLLHPKSNQKLAKAEKKAVSSASASASSLNSSKCFLKVHGIGEAPFLMELVAYDTIKTVRSLLSNVLRSEFIKLNRDSADFKLFIGFPRRMLNDDSKSLGDLGLVPNGVLHLVQCATL